MNLHNFNSSNRAWKMYANTLSSISGDHLTMKPYDGRNLLLEVSANNDIFINKGTTSYNLSNLITATTTSYVSGSDASFSNIDVSRNLTGMFAASGGIITTNDSNTIHSFRTVGTSTFRPFFSGSVEVLIVGGGGGGGQAMGGGGGGGGVIWIPATNVSADTSYSIVVGDGGASGTNGQNSTAFGAIAAGGGTSGSFNTGPGISGGSGGGAPANQYAQYGGIIYNGGASSGNSLGANNGIANVGIIYGNRGGNMTHLRIAEPSRAAGGGGAGGQGLDTNPNVTGNTGQTGMGSGGVGVVNAILGPSYYWAGGGGGSNTNGSGSNVNTGGWGGLGGGGAGATEGGIGTGGGSALNSGANGGSGANTNGGAGGANTGGGGGGGAWVTGQGGKGGSGIVVIRYTNPCSLGTSNKYWGNAFIRDLSARNISISGTISVSGDISNVRQIIPQLTNDISTSLGTISNTWQRAFIRDLSAIVTINGSTWPLTILTGLSGPTGLTGPTGPTGISGPTGPVGPTGTTTISDISNQRIIAYQRIYQNICGDISWNAVNGYYGLAKDAYPSLNPLSSGVKAFTNITTRTRFTWPIASCCWSPQLLRFVGAGWYRATWSNDGINWTENFIGNQDSRLNHGWNSICWSPELMLFVAVGDGKTMRSSNGITWIFTSEFATASWRSVCWSPELRLFVATGASGTNNRVITSPNGIDWTRQTGIPDNTWNNVCWSAELGIFIAASDGGTNIFMSSRNGINWTALGIPPNTVGVRGICWSKELGLFVAVSGTTSMISNNGLTWNIYSINWSGNGNAWSICWIPELKLFVVTNDITSLLQLNTSHNGINWNPITYNGVGKNYRNVTWSPELGIFVTISSGGGDGAIHTVLVSSLKGRPPTSYNVFDSSFNRIDENGKWDFSNINVTTLTVSNGPPITSDDRLKHNEIVIANGLDIIDQLTPKFYQKTQVLLDASYNGDLSNYAWNHEAGLIAQELLQINDLSYVVSGGDYYEQTYNLITQTNDSSNANYDISNTNYDISHN